MRQVVNGDSIQPKEHVTSMFILVKLSSFEHYKKYLDSEQDNV